MKFYNLNDHNEQVSFTDALKQGLGRRQGIFFPLDLPTFCAMDIDRMLEMDFVRRCGHILSALIGDEMDKQALQACVKAAFSFPAPVKMLSDSLAVLELFHGPTLAFKDYGVRFMAQMLACLDDVKNAPITILTATSGDTGAAVAQAFYGMKNSRVVILYPAGKITPMQEKLFCTLGGNIETYAVDGDFDACQALVKQAFDDGTLKQRLRLNSANSINIARLLAQVCYYFDAVAQLSPAQRNQLVVAVPCGNFGNLTAGLLAKALGLPIKRFIAATNANDTVVRFLQNGEWAPKATVATLSNAMDVRLPNNWPRIMELFRRKNWPLRSLACGSVSDAATQAMLCELAEMGYLSEPHGAVACSLLREQLSADEFGLFLGTAHPAKFKECVEAITGRTVPLPDVLAQRHAFALLSKPMTADFAALRRILLAS